MSKLVIIKPIDVWLFRDGKPFSAGGDHRAESLFPPYPTVIQGAFRSKQLALMDLLRSDPTSIEREVGSPSNFGKLRLKGPYLIKINTNGSFERLLPQPADAISDEADKRMIHKISSPEPHPAGTSSSLPEDLMLLGLKEKPIKGESRLWVTEESLSDYMAGKPVKGIHSSELFEFETRTGNSLDSTRMTTVEGMLYEVTFIRLQDSICLAVEFDGYEGWPKTGLMQLGGEYRPAFYELMDAPVAAQLPTHLPDRFRIYFTTPTYFDGGWRPSGNDWSKYFTGSVKLAAAAIGRYETVGGFDMAKSGGSQNFHKAARRFVPAGSVYYFVSAGAALRPDLIQSAITDYAPEIGFGQFIFVKEW